MRWDPYLHEMIVQVGRAGRRPTPTCSSSGWRYVPSGLLERDSVLCRAGSKFISADVSSGNLVLDPFDLGLREHRLEELELCGTGCSVAGGHWPDGAVAECDPITLIRKLVELGHIPLRVEDLGQCCHLLLEALARQLVSDLLDAPMLTAIKDTGEKIRIFLLDVAEQLNGEVTGGLGEQRFSLMGAVVEVGGSPRVSGSSSLLACRDKSSRSEDSQLLTNGARRDRQGLSEVLDRRLPPSLQRDKDLALCRGKVDQGDRLALHGTILPGEDTLCEFRKVQLVRLDRRGEP